MTAWLYKWPRKWGFIGFEWAVHNGMEAEWRKRVVGAGGLQVKVDGNHLNMMENEESVR